MTATMDRAIATRDAFLVTMAADGWAQEDESGRYRSLFAITVTSDELDGLESAFASFLAGQRFYDRDLMVGSFLVTICDGGNYEVHRLDSPADLHSNGIRVAGVTVHSTREPLVFEVWHDSRVIGHVSRSLDPEVGFVSTLVGSTVMEPGFMTLDSAAQFVAKRDPAYLASV